MIRASDRGNAHGRRFGPKAAQRVDVAQIEYSLNLLRSKYGSARILVVDRQADALHAVANPFEEGECVAKRESEVRHHVDEVINIAARMRGVKRLYRAEFVNPRERGEELADRRAD